MKLIIMKKHEEVKNVFHGFKENENDVNPNFRYYEL